jgi:hypothetical protein
MVGDRRMKCSDIPDEVFLAAVRRTPAMDGTLRAGSWRTRWKVQLELERVLGPIPEKLFLAKAKCLGKRGLLGGCTNCSCRGDYHIAAECRSYGCCSMDEPVTVVERGEDERRAEIRAGLYGGRKTT